MTRQHSLANTHVSQLLDVGTTPKPNAINRLVVAMEYNGQIGGCSGQLVVRRPNYLNLFEVQCW